MARKKVGNERLTKRQRMRLRGHKYVTKAGRYLTRNDALCVSLQGGNPERFLEVAP